jgi:hypothetical protein
MVPINVSFRSMMSGRFVLGIGQRPRFSRWSSFPVNHKVFRRNEIEFSYEAKKTFVEGVLGFCFLE